jgi:hypothetical protein
MEGIDPGDRPSRFCSGLAEAGERLEIANTAIALSPQSVEMGRKAEAARIPG